MRIISGSRKGHPLRVPKSGARPTTDRTREAVFNILESRIDFENIRVLDLFAGSGALALEALSRGAASATMVEQSTQAVQTIRSNVDALRFTDHCEIARDDVFRFLQRKTGTYDLIFADPPYDLEKLPTLVGDVFGSMGNKGIFVLEHDRRHDFSDHSRLLTTRAYGRSIVSVFGFGENTGDRI